MFTTLLLTLKIICPIMFNRVSLFFVVRERGCAMGEVVLCAGSCVAGLFCLWLFVFGLALIAGATREFTRIHWLIVQIVSVFVKRHKTMMTTTIIVLLASAVMASLMMK